LLLKMLIKEKKLSEKQIIGIGQLLISVGLGCNVAALLLSRFTNTGDFFLGFLTGLGLVFLGVSAVFNISRFKKKREPGE